MNDTRIQLLMAAALLASACSEEAPASQVGADAFVGERYQPFEQADLTEANITADASSRA